MKLPRRATILEASRLIASMRQTLATGAPLRIDASEVDQVDTCILQLLCAARFASPDVSIQNPSDTFLTALHRCGLQRAMLGNRQEAA